MKWTARGDAGVLRSLAPELERALASRASGRTVVEVGGRRLFWKWSPLTGRARVRLAARELFGQELPRVAEYENLLWLRAHGFGAPLPVVAGSARRRGVPLFQFLFTEEVAGAVGFEEVLARPPAERAGALDALARETARLHASGFVHRDLFPRNLLVTGESAAPHVHFLDAWRGGPRPGLRGPGYDLGCFLHDAAEALGESGAAAFLDAYAAERERLGAPASMDALRAAIRRTHAQRARRDARAARRRAARRSSA